VTFAFFGCAVPQRFDVDPVGDPDEERSELGYRLQSGDQVDVQVYREPQLSGIFRVDEHGFIRHPLCGPVAFSGLTLNDAEARLTELLGEKYLVNPVVILSIESAQSSRIVLLGEVESPGIHPIPFGESITLLQAIAEAGGFTDLASVDRVTVTRTVDGKEISVRARVSRMISGKEPDMKLQPNDVIMVPQVLF
jgi:polysaccharide export outer membrane protein